MPHKARMMYGCDSNNFYATKLEMHDPYLWFQDEQGKSHIVLSALEVGRGRRVAKADFVHASSDIKKELDALEKVANIPNLAFYLAEKFKATEIEVPSNFPTDLAFKLTDMGLKIVPAQGAFFPDRAIKKPEEIEAIRAAQAINQKAFEHAFNIFDQAKIESNLSLSYKGEKLTSEFIQGQMNSINASYGCTGFNGGPIVACGAQGADPHERGRGLLKANELIIIDSFPLAANHYNGDLTRTLVKGEASAWQTSVMEAVLKAQKVGCDTAKNGITGAQVHEAVDKSLINDGFTTGTDEDGNPYGFFHSTGHALGLDVHDDGPGVSPFNKNPLKENMVVTIEPGVYYTGKGGARIEDIVAIKEDGIDNLTTLTKEWLIK